MNFLRSPILDDAYYSQRETNLKSNQIFCIKRRFDTNNLIRFGSNDSRLLGYASQTLYTFCQSYPRPGLPLPLQLHHLRSLAEARETAPKVFVS